MSNKMMWIAVLCLIASCLWGAMRYKSNVRIVEGDGYCPEYIVREVQTPVYKESTKKIPILNVVEMKDKELLQRIQKTIEQQSLYWAPEEQIRGFKECMTSRGNAICYSSDRYLSLYNVYVTETSMFELYFTVDMQTGEAVYLDDLVTVDEELAERFLDRDIVQSDRWGEFHNQNPVTGEQEQADEASIAYMLEKLQECCRGCDKKGSDWGRTEYFYIRNNRLYISEVMMNGYNTVSYYVTLDQLEDKLKVEKW